MTSKAVDGVMKYSYRVQIGLHGFSMKPKLVKTILVVSPVIVNQGAVHEMILHYVCFDEVVIFVFCSCMLDVSTNTDTFTYSIYVDSHS